MKIVFDGVKENLRKASFNVMQENLINAKVGLEYLRVALDDNNADNIVKWSNKVNNSFQKYNTSYMFYKLFGGDSNK